MLVLLLNNYAVHVLQVLDWAGLLLNAHYTQLVITPEAHELLVSCHKIVAQQVNEHQSWSFLPRYNRLHLCYSVSTRENVDLEGSKLTFCSTSKVLFILIFFFQQTGNTTSKFLI